MYMYLFERGGGKGKTLSFSSEPLGGFHPNTISSKLLGITFPEKEPKILYFGGGVAPPSKRKNGP